jgi:hypothetical protein
MPNASEPHRRRETFNMALSYQTEYRLGCRGRIRRSFTGYQAFFAIFFDLVFGLVFELVTSVIGLALRLVFRILQVTLVVLCKSWSTLVAVMAVVLSLLTLPFVVLHQAVDRLRSRTEAGRRDSYRASTAKPDWAFGREV